MYSHYQNVAHTSHLVLQCLAFRLSFLLWPIIQNPPQEATGNSFFLITKFTITKFFICQNYIRQNLQWLKPHKGKIPIPKITKALFYCGENYIR
jgi:hypothetical protein